MTTHPASAAAPRRRRSRRTLTVIAAIALVAATGFAALGIWQVERLVWKNALITAVTERSTAAPVPATEFWAGFTPDTDEYRHVSATGAFDPPAEVLVQAVTDYGGGFWVITPLRLDSGQIILINRGFIPPDRRDPAAHPAPTGPVTINGLLRASEPDGGFLRANDPAANRWFSRDVAAIATARELSNTAPFFVDADRGADPAAYPIGGLTVLSFSNNHLIYALTWFALALMMLAAFGYVLWDDRRPHKDLDHDHS